MMKKRLQRLLPVAGVGFLLLSLGFGRAASQSHDELTTPPIELSEITLEYGVQNDAGKLVWETPQPDAPNTIPAGALRLRFTAKVNNRPKGAKIRLRVILQELCPSPDGEKKYLARLRHLTETDPGNQTVHDPNDDELQVVRPDGRVMIELPVHCEDCLRAVCGRECPDRDHLGEGPHIITLTTTDPPTTEQNRARTKATPPAKPSSFKLDIMSVCPLKERKISRQ